MFLKVHFSFMKVIRNLLFCIILCHIAFVFYNEHEALQMSRKCYLALHDKSKNKEKDYIGRVYDSEESLRFTFYVHDYYVIPSVLKKSYVNINFCDGLNYSDCSFDLFPWFYDVLQIMDVDKLYSIAFQLVELGNPHSYIFYNSFMVTGHEDGPFEQMSNSEIIDYVDKKLKSPR